MDTEALRTFVDVVTTGSFSAVARRDGVAPSSVSRQVTALEDSLGVRLLQRTTRKLSLTEAGEVFHARVVQTLADLDETIDAVTSLDAGPRGLLRVSTPVAFGRMHLTPMFPDLLRAFPQLRLDVLMHDGFVDLVSESIDVAIRIGHLRDSSLVARRLADNERIIVGSPAYLDEHGRPESPQDLCALDCLAFRYEATGTRWKLRKDGETTTVPVGGRLTINSGLALVDAARRDVGLVLVPRWMVHHELDAGALEVVLPGHEVTATEFGAAIWALYPSREYLPAKVRAFVEFMEARMKPTPPWA